MQFNLSALKASLSGFVFDTHFWVAVVLGPVVWVIMWVLSGMPAIGISLTILLGSVILFPIIEELAFRGFIQTWLLESSFWKSSVISKISRANVLTSVLFAALHLINQPLIWAVLIFFPSLVFGYLRERYDAVTPSILVHSWYNFGFLCLYS